MPTTAANPQYKKRVDQISDRAKRYRANATPPKGQPRCELCGSTRQIIIDHRDGNEANNRQQNKRWLCRSCNAREGARQVRLGVGVRTRQFNPRHTTRELRKHLAWLQGQAKKGSAEYRAYAQAEAARISKELGRPARRPNLPARNLAAYTEAVIDHQRGAHDYGGSIIHDTPFAHRSKFAKEIWRRRRGEAPERVKLNRPRRRRGNPTPLEEAAARYATFHGQTPRQLLDVQRSDRVRQTYWTIGPLDELEIAGPKCDLQGVDFASLEPEDEIPGTIPLDFTRDGVTLAADPRGRSLYLIDGAQYLDSDDLAYFQTDTRKDLIELGPVVSLTYQARKPPDYQQARYRHFLGENSGQQPIAFYDRIKQEIGMIGGRYHVKDWIYD